MVYVYFHKNKESKLDFGDHVVVLNNFLYFFMGMEELYCLLEY